MKVDLSGKFAVVTGAGRGIGQAIADTLAANGAAVAYVDIDLVAAQEAAARQRNSLALKMDVSDEQQVNSAVAEILDRFGRVDILVNNAGVNTNHRVNIDQFPLDEWQRIVSIDLTGTYLVSRSVALAMKRQQTGRIINIASVLGIVPARRQCAYTAAKSGVIQLTRTMAIELAESGILVNCVAPGSTLTEGTKELFYGKSAAERERAERMLSHIPLGRPGTVEEIAYAVLFFAAPASAYVTGQTLCVDGGWSAGGFFRDF
jgi:NAD(P)-dependent dehydrogenase (short-subunit alcohol dehydrogenase family)